MKLIHFMSLYSFLLLYLFCEFIPLVVLSHSYRVAIDTESLVKVNMFLISAVNISEESLLSLSRLDFEEIENPATWE